MKEIYSYDEVNFKNFDKEALFLFDINSTLLNTIGSLHKDYLQFYKLLEKKYPRLKDYNYIAYLHTIAMMTCKKELVEKNIVNIVNSLKNVIVLSGFFTGMHNGDLIEKQWFEILKSFDFKFSKVIKNMQFNNFSKHYQSYPAFYNGLLFSNCENKGKVLLHLLDKMHKKPTEIIFFDNSQKNINSLHNVCTTHNIKFSGYLYLGGKNNKFQKDSVIVQLEHLIKNKKWLALVA